MDSDDEKKLQTDLIMGTSGAAAAVLPADPPKTERTVRRSGPTSRAEKQVDALMNALALLGVLGIAAVIWWWGAGFTVDFLAALSPQIQSLGWKAWAIPVLVTMIELRYWRHMTTLSVAGVVVFFVLVFDIGSSFSGFTRWAVGRTLPLFTGIPFPTGGASLWILGISMGVVFAFAPERLVRWALAELAALRKK